MGACVVASDANFIYVRVRFNVRAFEKESLHYDRKRRCDWRVKRCGCLRLPRHAAPQWSCRSPPRPFTGQLWRSTEHREHFLWDVILMRDTRHENTEMTIWPRRTAWRQSSPRMHPSRSLPPSPYTPQRLHTRDPTCMLASIPYGPRLMIDRHSETRSASPTTTSSSITC